MAGDPSASSAASWSVQSSPNPPGATETVFEDVSCASSTFCVGVGNANKGGSSLQAWPNGTIESWDGNKWSLWPGSSAGELYGVSCPSSSFCVAVGSRLTDQVLVETRDGSYWEFQSTPEFEANTNSVLTDVSCTSETACTAVGNSGGSQVIMRWNGTEWSLQAPAVPPEAEGESVELRGISCGSSTACMAVGEFFKKVEGSYVRKAFAEQWNGSEWTITKISSPGGFTESELEDVACTSATNCIAVGNEEGGARALTEQWNGSEWGALPTPQPSEPKGAVGLRGISCPASNSCFAVGGYLSAKEGIFPSEEKTLVESWNGAKWTIQSSPNPEGQKFNRLSAVSCTSSSACTAVGRSQVSRSNTAKVTLAERYE